ncbi:MAG: hypothetical protein ACREQL_09555 [Candidatus Binatia bacterium]
MRVAAALLLAGTAVRVDAIDTPPPLGPCGPITRRHEHVEVQALQLRKLGRPPIDHVGVIALRDGKPLPIPFQIDERQGRQIAMADGAEPSGDSWPGVLDFDDVLVFLPCDAGARATAAELTTAVPGLGSWREIRLDDPIDGTHGFAYVVVAEHPPATDRRYVAYEPRADLVSTAAYRIGMVQALPNYFALALGHPLGPNLLDGLRLRADATLRGGLATVTLTERDAKHTLIAWRAGPVRVVRRSRHDVDLLGIGIHVSAGIANTAFYPMHVFGPGSMKLPISPGVLFRDITAMGGVDLRDLRGWRFVAPGTPPGGLAIDGAMDALERAFTADDTWFVLVRGREAILVAITLSENLARIPFGIVYEDDATRAAPPELERGSVPLVGFRGRGIQRLAADRYRFDLRVFLLPDYRAGDERRVLAQRTTPLVIEVTPPASPASAPASAP